MKEATGKLKVGQLMDLHTVYDMAGQLGQTKVSQRSFLGFIVFRGGPEYRCSSSEETDLSATRYLSPFFRAGSQSIFVATFSFLMSCHGLQLVWDKVQTSH